jgi:hypothetical protein
MLFLLGCASGWKVFKLSDQISFGQKNLPCWKYYYLLVFASSLEFTPVNIVFTMKVLLLLPLEREREREVLSKRRIANGRIPTCGVGDGDQWQEDEEQMRRSMMGLSFVALRIAWTRKFCLWVFLFLFFFWLHLLCSFFL